MKTQFQIIITFYYLAIPVQKYLTWFKNYNRWLQSCECALNLISQRHLSPPISNKTWTLKYNRNEMHALWAPKTLHSPDNTYFHVITTVFYAIIIFYLIGNKSRFSSVRNKSHFHVEGYRKAQWCKGKDYIGALRIDSNDTHEETKNFITAAVVFEGNQKHFMLFAELHICHKILEIDSKPLPEGWKKSY